MQDKYSKYIYHRNNACRIKEYIYKGLRTVTLENELIKVTVLADKGTDIIEFLYKPMDMDFMWHSFNDIKDPAHYIETRQHPAGSFLDFYEGGWQEIFPTIGDPCDYKGAPIGYHGEISLLSWDYQITLDTPEEIAVEFRTRTIRTPYFFQKQLKMKTNDPTLYINETIINEGSSDLMFAWAHHPAFGPVFLDESCIIELPKGSEAKTYDGDLGINQILPPGVSFHWPYIEDKAGNKRDLSHVPSPDDRSFSIVYIANITNGNYQIINMNKHVGFGLKWDKDIFPVIWVWMPYGGAEDYPWYGRNYNLAIEPWSAVPDRFDEVIKNGKGILIKPGQKIQTSLQAYAYTN